MKKGEVIKINWELEIIEVDKSRDCPYKVRLTSMGEDKTTFTCWMREYDLENPAAEYLAAHVAKANRTDKVAPVVVPIVYPQYPAYPQPPNPYWKWNHVTCGNPTPESQTTLGSYIYPEYSDFTTVNSEGGVL